MFRVGWLTSMAPERSTNNNGLNPVPKKGRGGGEP